MPEPVFPPYIPEVDVAQSAMNDVALRVQQIVIGLDVYKRQLSKMEESLPGMLVQGYETPELPLHWGVTKSPEMVGESLKRSITFTLLNAMNMHLYLIDDYLKILTTKYYGYNPEDSSWFTPEIFGLQSGVDLTKVKNFQEVDDMRQTIKRFREFKITRSTTTTEYFDLYPKLIGFIHDIGNSVAKHQMEKEKKAENNDKTE